LGQTLSANPARTKKKKGILVDPQNPWRRVCFSRFGTLPNSLDSVSNFDQIRDSPPCYVELFLMPSPGKVMPVTARLANAA
jgi:hypothetical protein